MANCRSFKIRNMCSNDKTASVHAYIRVINNENAIIS